MLLTEDPHRAAGGNYRRELGQPTAQRVFEFECPPLLQFRHIDAWLTRVFDCPVTELPTSGIRGHHEATAGRLAWRILVLGSILLQGIRVPAFEPGAILELRRLRESASRWRATAMVPAVDCVPHAYSTLAYRQAVKLASWMAGRAVTIGNAQRLFAEIDSKLIQACSTANLGGASTLQLLREAWALRMPFRHLGNGVYQLGWGARQVRVARGAVQTDSAVGAKITQDKWHAATLAREAGLPAPVHALVTSADAARTAAHELGWPLVVKPANRDRGEGVTVGVRDLQGVTDAFARAAALSPSVLVERQAPGTCHRILVVNGKVRIVAKRLAKSVKGDGISTVQALVDAANREQEAKPPWARLKPFPLDALALQCLAQSGLAPDSVPSPGSYAPLRPIQTTEWGGVVEYFTHSIHPDNVAVAVRAARLFGLVVAGVDIISPDITRPWYENGAILNEVNFSPLLGGQTTGPALSEILREWLPGGGRIPVDVVVGGVDAFSQGLRLREQAASEGLRCWLTNHDTTVAHDGRPAVLAVHGGLHARCRAILLDPTVDVLVVVVQTDEWLATGLPMDRIRELLQVRGGPGDPIRQMLAAYALEPKPDRAESM